MLKIEKRFLWFKAYDIWFADEPFDIKGAARVLFRACKKKIALTGFSCRPFVTSVLDLTRSIETLRASCASATRNAISRAEREGVIVHVNTKYDEFLVLNRQFASQKDLDVERGFTVDFMKRYGDVFVCEYNGEVIAGQFYMKDARNMRLLFAPSKRLAEDKEKAKIIGFATRLLVFKAMEYAKEKGITEFDLGGFYVGDNDRQKEQINFFKKGFGGKLVEHYMYEKCYSPLLLLKRQLFGWRK